MNKDKLVDLLINASIIGHRYQRREEFEILADKIICLFEHPYSIYLKSHCAAPDFEAEVSATSKLEAAKKFKEMPRLIEWSLDGLLDCIEELI